MKMLSVIGRATHGRVRQQREHKKHYVRWKLRDFRVCFSCPFFSFLFLFHYSVRRRRFGRRRRLIVCLNSLLCAYCLLPGCVRVHCTICFFCCVDLTYQFMGLACYVCMPVVVPMRVCMCATTYSILQ